jgi:hypothetical protein
MPTYVPNSHFAQTPVTNMERVTHRFYEAIVPVRFEVLYYVRKAVCCVVCGVWCVLCAVCCVLCVVCGMLNAICSYIMFKF